MGGRWWGKRCARERQRRNDAFFSREVSLGGRERESERASGWGAKETGSAPDGDRASEKKEGRLEKRERDGMRQVWSAGGLLDSLVYMRLHAVSVYNETRGKGRWGHCPIYSIFFFFFPFSSPLFSMTSLKLGTLVS